MQQILQRKMTMIHSFLHFVYQNILEHFDFFGSMGGTAYGVYLVLQNPFMGFLVHLASVAFFAVFGAMTGWLAKIFIIYPFHRYLKQKYPDSKLFNK